MHFVREQISKNKIKLKYCPTHDMTADIFTKGFATDKFVKLRHMLGIVNHNESLQCEEE